MLLASTYEREKHFINQQASVNKQTENRDKKFPFLYILPFFDGGNEQTPAHSKVYHHWEHFTETIDLHTACPKHANERQQTTLEEALLRLLNFISFSSTLPTDSVWFANEARR